MYTFNSTTLINNLWKIKLAKCTTDRDKLSQAKSLVDLCKRNQLPYEDSEVNVYKKAHEHKKIRILSNKAQCSHCHKIIESRHVHDYVRCECKRIAVDGGKEYLRRCFMESTDLIELSEWEEIDDAK